MTQNESSTAAASSKAALLQWLHASKAAEAKAAVTDTQLEAAARPFEAGPTMPTCTHEEVCKYNARSRPQR